MKHAVEQSKPVLVLNLGPTRADGLAGTEKMEISTGEVLVDTVRAILCASLSAIISNECLSDFECRGSGARDPIIEELLTSGEIRQPPSDPSDDGPRAVG